MWKERVRITGEEKEKRKREKKRKGRHTKKM